MSLISFDAVAAADQATSLFEEFVDRHKDALVNYIHTLTNDRDQAEDFAQESFLRVYRALDDFDGGSSNKSYLYTTATNLVRSHYRRSYRWAALKPRIEAVETGVATSCTEGEVLENEIQHRVREAIEKLPVRYKAPLVLRDIEGWSYEEIAKSLECRTGTIKSRINRARSRLKRELQRYWNGEE